MVNTAIVLGTSRNNGNTHSLVRELEPCLNANVLNLSGYNISPYDYKHKNRDDDFLPLIRQLLEFDHIALASPIYWYTVSSQMKIFMDRLSDLLTIETELGRLLRSKTGSLIATGYDLEPPPCFEDVLVRSFSYLGMNYAGMLYCNCEDIFKLVEHRKNIHKYVNVIGKLHNQKA